MSSEHVREEVEVNKGTSEAIYLFCFTRAEHPPRVEGNGVDGRSRVFLKRFLDIVAVLSRVSLEEFCGPTAESNMQDLSWVGPRVCRHEEVIEQMMQHAPVFPARFGTLFSSLEMLRGLITLRHETISHFFDQIADKEEWAVKGFIDRENARKVLLSIILAEQSERLVSMSPGVRYFQEQRIQAGVEKDLSAWLRSTCKEIAEDLGRFAPEACERRTLPRGAAGHDMDMVLNWAFLVPRGAMVDFRKRIDQANGDYAQRGLVFELSGPWPPYSFSPSLEIETAV